jgi:hypothetical protein
MNQLATINEPRGIALTAADVKANVQLVQEVMSSIMKEGTHYGIIPGCKQPSLYKAGSEVLLSTFRIAVSVIVEDLSSDDCIRYRVRTIGTHQASGIVVGEGVGECSSNETKYKWRRCYIDEEFDATPENRRRIKFAQANGKTYRNKEIRNEHEDLANTILKMAKKRAQIDMTLTALAVSDIFSQDLEDMPEGLREHADDRPQRQQQRSTRQESSQQETDSPERQKLITELNEIADTGVEALIKRWGELTKEDRELVGTAFKAIKSRAEAAK